MKLTVNLTNKNYDIIIENGLLSHVNDYLNPDNRYLIVSDDGVPFEYVRTLYNQLPNSEYLIIANGEQSKCMENYQKILSRLLIKGYSRKDNIIALGGGVIGDLTGFAAATFKRGMHFINIPTTSLAMVDSSIGGKVAIDFNGIKNCVGAFYQPDIVLIDPDTLKTLPERHINNGLIEAVKTGLIGDKELFEMFLKPDYKNNINDIIVHSLNVKRMVVEQDEKEENLRKILNFGHTLGHAYESYFNFETYLHGEAVALGMLDISRGETYYNDLKRIISEMGININPSVDKEKMLSYIVNDKKANGEYVDAVFVHEAGKAEIKKIRIEDLRKCIGE